MQIVLVNPDIPQNTGTIARTCAATQVELHLVGKLGFELTEKRIRRAGLDYWPWVSVTQHASWEDYLAVSAPEQLWYFTTHGVRNYFEPTFGENDALVFGSETRGLGQEFLAKTASENQLKIPMRCEHVRSLNLSNAVNIVLYHALVSSGAFA